MTPDFDQFSWVAATVAISPRVPPTVTTQAATNVEFTTATLNGNVTAINANSIIARGFVFDTVSRGEPGNIGPAGSGYASNSYLSSTFGTGAFSAAIAGLSSGTTYYYRACASNNAGYWT